MGPQLQDAHWVMAYFRKTQSFMKNGGQQKCLDKALFWYQNILFSWEPGKRYHYIHKDEQY